MKLLLEIQDDTIQRLKRGSFSRDMSDAEYNKAFADMLTKALRNATIVAEDSFSIDGHTYYLDFESEEIREKIKQEVNLRTEFKWDWFHEETGNENWVLYNNKMYEVISPDEKHPNRPKYLHYKETSGLAPELPINCSSCHYMFSDLSTIKELSLNKEKFDTRDIVTMCGMFSGCSSVEELNIKELITFNVRDMQWMFADCENLTYVNLDKFNTERVNSMVGMFSECTKLEYLDLRSFNPRSLSSLERMFYNCNRLETIEVSDNWLTFSVRWEYEVFTGCTSLPNYRRCDTGSDMAKSIDKGGYLYWRYNRFNTYRATPDWN